MEKMTLKNKILSVIAILLCLVIIGALVQMISTVANANKSSSDEDLSGFDVVFNGKTNILGEDYDIVLKGKDFLGRCQQYEKHHGWNLFLYRRARMDLCL